MAAVDSFVKNVVWRILIFCVVLEAVHRYQIFVGVSKIDGNIFFNKPVGRITYKYNFFGNDDFLTTYILATLFFFAIQLFSFTYYYRLILANNVTMTQIPCSIKDEARF